MRISRVADHLHHLGVPVLWSGCQRAIAVTVVVVAWAGLATALPWPASAATLGGPRPQRAIDLPAHDDTQPTRAASALGVTTSKQAWSEAASDPELGREAEPPADAESHGATAPKSALGDASDDAPAMLDAGAHDQGGAGANDEVSPQPTPGGTEEEAWFDHSQGLPVAPMPEGGAPLVTPWPPGAPPKPSQESTELRLLWGGYLRFVAEAVENDAGAPFVGRNDGFKLANGRLSVQADYGLASFVLSIEALSTRRTGLNDANARFSVDAKDAYLALRISPHADLHLGRFRAPHDLGQLVDTEARLFIDAPLPSRGVPAGLGYETPGLSSGRQIGVMLHRERLGVSEALDFGYALALTNGLTEGLAFNDNDRLAGFARAYVHVADVASVHFAGFLDSRSLGELPNLLDERVTGLEASVVASFSGLSLEGQLLFQRTEFLTTGRPNVDALGFHVQWAYTLARFSFAYRYAWLDPNLHDAVGQASDSDAVSEHTVALGYAPSRHIPLRFAVEGTLAREQAGRRLDNNRIAALAQLEF